MNTPGFDAMRRCCAALRDVPGGYIRVTAVRGRRRIQAIDRDGRALHTEWRNQMDPAELRHFIGYGNRWGW